jgi:hypothetical protein
MTTVLFDEVVTAPAAPRLGTVPAHQPTAVPAPTQVCGRRDDRPIGDDPLIAGAARLLCIPVRQLYAALWRMGVLEVDG